MATTSAAAGPVRARDLIEANTDLDLRLHQLLMHVREESMHDTALDHEWTVAQHLGAIAEQQGFAARQLRLVLLSGRRTVGRSTALDADHVHAVEAAADSRLGPLLTDVGRTADALQEAVELVRDAHLRLVVVDVVHGRRPLRTHVLWHVLRPKFSAAQAVAATLHTAPDASHVLQSDGEF